MLNSDVSAVDIDEKVGDRVIVNNNLGRYFDNNAYTVFDDIISSRSEEVSESSTSQMVMGSNDTYELSLMSERISPDLFKNDSIFNAERSIESGSSDFHRDAWIPCERTRKVLRSIATSPTCNNFPDRDFLTMPGLTFQGDMVDATREASIHFFGEDESSHRNILTATDVTQDERGLRNLIQSGCYRAAINLSGRLLAVYGQGYGKLDHTSKHTPHSLQLWYTRLSLLAKLRQIDVMKAEAQPFGNLDNPDMYFIFYPELYGTRHGSMASFAFRLLLAELPAYYGKVKESIDNLYKLLATINQMTKNLSIGLAEEGGRVKFGEIERDDSMKLWNRRRCRVLISIVNCALIVKNFVLAIDVLLDLCQSRNWTHDQSEILKSAIRRVHLFHGDVFSAEKKFSIDKNIQSFSPSSKELVDRGLMAVAQNAFREAYTCFMSASDADASNIMLINNRAVCLLYSGQLKEAVQLLEKAITRNPIVSLQEPVLLNISTLHELHTTYSKELKLHLLRLMNRYKGDATDIFCLKLT